MKKYILILFSVFASLAIASCNLGAPAPQSQSALSTAAAQTVQAVLTSSAVTSTVEPPVPQAIASATPTPAGCQELSQITTWTRDGVTYDVKEVDKKLAPSTGFVMSLIVQNTGTCDWTDAYRFNFETGEKLTEQASIPVMPKGYIIHPGESLTITVQMTAPSLAGDYHSSYTLTSDKAEDVFTIGIETKVGNASNGALPAPGELRYAYDCSSGAVVITLTWLDKSDGEDGFRIYRDGNKLAELAADSTSYSDTVPVSGKYKYTVAAYDTGGESSVSVNAQTTNCQ